MHAGMGNKESKPDYTSQRYLHPEIYTLAARNPTDDEVDFLFSTEELSPSGTTSSKGIAWLNAY